MSDQAQQQPQPAAACPAEESKCTGGVCPDGTTCTPEKSCAGEAHANAECCEKEKCCAAATDGVPAPEAPKA